MRPKEGQFILWFIFLIVSTAYESLNGKTMKVTIKLDLLNSFTSNQMATFSNQDELEV